MDTTEKTDTTGEHGSRTAKAPRTARAGRTSDGYTRLAPDVEKDWIEQFVLEQRLIGVPGDRIGDALALVQSHVAESGERARDAFGDATAYARESAPTRRVESLETGWLLGTGLGLVGMLLTTVGAGAWLSDDRTLEVTTGLLVTGLLTVAVFATVVARTETVLRLATERIWLALVVVALWTGVVVAVLLLLDAPLVEVPAPLGLGVGVVLLVAGTALEWRTHAAGGLVDPVVGPGEVSRRSTDRLTWLTIFLFPVLTAVMVGLGRALDLLA